MTILVTLVSQAVNGTAGWKGPDMFTKSSYRRVLAYGVALAATAAAASIGMATPAQALPPSLTVMTSAMGVSPAAASAIVTCPPGSTLVGAGGRISNGNGNVVMTDVIPDVSAGTVTVWGHEKGPNAVNWQVSAFAICDTQITGVVRVGVTSANNSNSPKTVTPACPANTTLTGVGYQLVNGNGEVFPDDVTPNAALNGSTVTAFENGNYAPSWQLTGYAICATVPAGAAPQRVAGAGPANMISPKSQAAVCPAGTDLVGVGGELTGGLGNVVLDLLSPNAALTTATARGDEFANALWNVTGYAVCW